MKLKLIGVFFCIAILINVFGSFGQYINTPYQSPNGSGGLADSPWPMFRQNLNHTGLSPYDTSSNTGNLKWIFTTGHYVDSSSAIGNDGTIYFGSCDYIFYAINPDGSEKWNFPTAYYIVSSPAIDLDGTIYVGSRDHTLYAINPDGTEKWSFTTGDELWSSPIIGYDGTIYIGSYDHKLYAINPDGKEKWSFITNGYVHSSPAISPDGTIYIGSYDNNLYAINPDGTKKWHFRTGDIIDSSPAIGSDGTIYIGSYDHKFYAINPDSSEKWNFTTPLRVGEWSSPAIGSDGTIYLGSMANKLIAIKSNGIEKWNFSTSGDVWSPSIGSEGTIYFGSDDDYLHALNPDGTEKWSYLIGDDVRSSPVIGSDGTIYVGSDDNNLYAFGSFNIPPIAEAGTARTVSEGELVQFEGSGSYDPDGTITTFEWDFDSTDGLWWDTGAVPDTTGPTPIHIYGDDGEFVVTLRVIDNDNLTATDTCNITVLNINPTVTIESLKMDVEVGLRVAGRKCNDVGMSLYEDGNPIGYVSIERMPGPPDDQMAWIPLSIDFLKSYSATVTYTPEDPPNIGADPVWIYIKSQNGSINKIHHTFNVPQSKKRESEHWNHIEPWEVDLNPHFIGLGFEISSHITDPGSDDETLTYTYGSQIVTVTHLNNPPNPDPYPSPEVKPVDIIDTTTLVYEGLGTIYLDVLDDDGGVGTQIITIS